MEHRRRGLGLAVALPLIFLGATHPVIAAALLALAVIAFRVVGVIGESRIRRQAESAVLRRRPLVSDAVALPWQIVRGLFGALPQLLLGLGGAAVVTVGGAWLLRMLRDHVFARLGTTGARAWHWIATWGPDHPRPLAITLAVATALAVAATWYGPNSGTTRRGARLAANTWLSSRTATALIVVVALALAVLAAKGLFVSPVVVNWWPFGPPGLLF